VIRKHFADAKRELLKLADLEQGEAYELAFNSVMQRWEADGATRIVDWLVRTGITVEGTLPFSPPSLPESDSTRPRTRSVAFLEKWSRMQRLKEQMAEQQSRSPLALKEKQRETARAR
jgi:hypothetical protein